VDLAALRFPHPWRPYQERVLAALPALAADKRLHVVAAPGSGKTVLGLEIFRFLGLPTVVLSPTRTIRDQWLARLADFLPPGSAGPPAWAGRDLAELSFFTSLTYQALHTRARLAAAADPDAAETAELAAEQDSAGPSKTEVADVVLGMRAAGVRVLILDEAHHLRSDWWAAISQVVAGLEDVTLVALTGTPPYDVLGHEWSRYVELCGPIDEEISTPELVKAGTLCPHDDYVWLTSATPEEVAQLRGKRDAVQVLFATLRADPAFAAEVAAHPWAREPHAHLSELMAAPETAMALATLLRAAGQPAVSLETVIDAGEQDLPPLEADHWQLVLREYLFGAQWPDGPDAVRRRALSQRLRQDGLLRRRELSLTPGGGQWPQLATSAAKVAACLQIHEVESRERGDRLRQVILTDYIRDEELQRPAGASPPALGAWPVFQRLAAAPGSAGRTDLALHTGRLTVVHRALVTHLEAEIAEPVQTRPVATLPEYAEVLAGGSARLTGPLTRLLSRGEIRVVVGTRALLGEGWDAPVVNSLVLASTVGSYMTTNQMRGRAIRTDPGQPDKIASIWHLGAYAHLPSLLQPEEDEWHVRDLEEMARRFDTFVGLAAKQPVITGGLNRLDVAFHRRGECRPPVRAERNNAEMAARLRDRQGAAARWQQALDLSEIGRVVPSVRVPHPPRFKLLRYPGTLLVLLLQAGALAMTLAIPAVSSARRLPLVYLVLAVAVLLTVLVGPKAVRIGLLYLRHLPVDGSVRQIGLAVRDALCETGLLPATLRTTKVIVRQEADGVFHLALGDGTFAERSLYADCLYQVLAPIRNPRYLITRRSRHLGAERTDHHAVPSLLGTHTERANAFLRAWNARVGPGELVYTRSDAGRAALVRAQARAYANAVDKAVKRMDHWF
jgi:superfamily II DNA or RNA helicase